MSTFGNLDYTLTAADYQWMFLTLFVVTVSCWALHEFFERKLGMTPSITTTIDLQKEASLKSNPLRSLEMNNRLTKSLNVNGGYRIQVRGSVYFVKTLYTLSLFVCCTAMIGAYPQWFVDHFISMKAESVYFAPYLHVSASLVAFYSWETVANRYGKLSWSVIAHHWVTAAVALSILLGRYTPFATWYGYTLVAMSFPDFFMLGFRAQYSFQCPSFTRKGFLCAVWWYSLLIALNLLGQTLLIANSLLFHLHESIHIADVVIFALCIVCWLYDDYLLLKSLRSMSTQQYEDGDVLDRHSDRIGPRKMGGSMVFALSVMSDVNLEEGTAGQMEQTPNSQTIKIPRPKLSNRISIKMSTPPTTSRMMSKTPTSLRDFSLFRIDSLGPADRDKIFTPSVKDVFYGSGSGPPSGSEGGDTITSGPMEMRCIVEEAIVKEKIHSPMHLPTPVHQPLQSRSISEDGSSAGV